MSPEQLNEVRKRLKAFKHWRTVAKQDWDEGPGPDLEALLVHVDYLQAEVARLRATLKRAVKFAGIVSDWDSAFPDGFEMEDGVWVSPYELKEEFVAALTGVKQ